MPHVTPHLARLKLTRARRQPNRHQQHPRSLHQAACCFDNGAPAPASPRHSSASHAPRHRRYVAPHAARLKLTHDCRHRSHCQQSATLRCRIQHPASSLVRCRLSRPHQVSCPCNYLIAADSHAAHRPLVLKTTENLTAASALSGSGAPSGDFTSSSTAADVSALCSGDHPGRRQDGAVDGTSAGAIALDFAR